MSVGLVALLATATIVLAILGVSRLFQRDSKRLRKRVSVLADKNRSHAPAGAPSVQSFSFGISRMAELVLGSAWKQKTADLLAGADVALWPGEFATLSLAFASLGALAGLVLLESPWAAVALAAAGYGAPALHLRWRRRRRQMRCEQQLPHVLQQVVSSLRSGTSFARSIAVAAQSSKPPISKDFAVVLRETALGIPMDESLEAMARRMASPDFKMVVVAYQIQRESGGSLTAVLSKAAETVRLRLQLRGEVRTLTAQGRLSALIVSLLPVAVFLILMVTSRTYFDPLLEDWFGRSVLLGALVWQGIGALLILKIVNIKV